MGWFDDLEMRVKQEAGNALQGAQEHLAAQFANETVKLASTVSGSKVDEAIQAQIATANQAAPTLNPGAAVAAVQRNAIPIGLMAAFGIAVAWYAMGSKK